MHDTIVGLMNSYAEALCSLDAGRVNSFYADDPQFRAYMDGQVLTRDALSELVSQMCSSLQGFEVVWEGIEVTPLGTNTALAASRFKRVIVDDAGTPTEDWGTVTWVWTRQGDDWQIIHGHAGHYPGQLP